MDRGWNRLFLFCLVVALGAPTSSAVPLERFEGRVVAPDGETPLGGATISLSGHTGVTRTDASGRFSWAFVPQTPFQVIVVLPSGEVMRPVVIDRISGIATIRVNPLSEESVTVLGAAPGVTRPPASGASLLSGTQVAQRNRENLMQALETVAGVNQVSAGPMPSAA